MIIGVTLFGYINTIALRVSLHLKTQIAYIKYKIVPYLISRPSWFFSVFSFNKHIHYLQSLLWYRFISCKLAKVIIIQSVLLVTDIFLKRKNLRWRINRIAGTHKNYFYASIVWSFKKIQYIFYWFQGKLVVVPDPRGFLCL